jgi:TonB family protein
MARAGPVLKTFFSQPIAYSYPAVVPPRGMTMLSFFTRKTSAAVLAFAVIACFALPTYATDRKVQRRVQPVYPELAKRMRIGGTVHVEATVAADGSVTETKTLGGNKMLSPAAEEAIRKWKFVPESGPSTEMVDIDFRIEQLEPSQL